MVPKIGDYVTQSLVSLKNELDNYSKYQVGSREKSDCLANIFAINIDLKVGLALMELKIKKNSDYYQLGQLGSAKIMDSACNTSIRFLAQEKFDLPYEITPEVSQYIMRVPSASFKYIHYDDTEIKLSKQTLIDELGIQQQRLQVIFSETPLKPEPKFLQESKIFRNYLNVIRPQQLQVENAVIAIDPVTEKLRMKLPVIDCLDCLVSKHYEALICIHEAEINSDPTYFTTDSVRKDAFLDAIISRDQSVCEGVVLLIEPYLTVDLLKSYANKYPQKMDALESFMKATGFERNFTQYQEHQTLAKQVDSLSKQVEGMQEQLKSLSVNNNVVKEYKQMQHDLFLQPKNDDKENDSSDQNRPD